LGGGEELEGVEKEEEDSSQRKGAVDTMGSKGDHFHGEPPNFGGIAGGKEGHWKTGDDRSVRLAFSGPAIDVAHKALRYQG